MTTTAKIKVIICKVGEAPVVTEIEHTLRNMQAIVGGNIECVQLSSNVDLWCNEEGLFLCAPNRLIGRTPINGDFFIAGHDGEGETVGLTEAEAALWLARMRQAPVAITSLV